MLVAADAGGAVAPVVPAPAAGPAPVDANGIPISAGFYGIPAPGGVVSVPTIPTPIDTVPWYSPAPTVPQPTPAVFELPAVSAGAQTAPVFQPPFAQDFPVQTPGSFVAPVGGAVVQQHGFPGSGLITINFGGSGAWSQSSREQLASMPYAPHVAVRGGLGGIGRVLAGLGLAGPHRLPRDLERHAATRTPLTP